ncbi:MAG: hypothetical protein EWM48_04010 [Sphaerochaeta sp.]|jgi:hypothetical protein|nr:MAG: hypothetical protein EWM48_04010 [Sphaerochaeta sp.]HPB42020.1 hypothetical protein [Sphaerochaeta sp.]HPY46130.1 hypothetical protein [Sphaerochaeta sp.]HQB05956.1 hypothetical protein [Sphaerochaeta sp.]
MSIFETIMLACFGMAWPVNIMKTVRSKTARGRSLMFQAIILVGYISGIIHKLLYSLDIVLFLYCLNFVMVGIDGALLLYYKRKEACCS